MFVNERIEVKVVPRTRKYWISKGYTGDIIHVLPEDLPKNSNIDVDMICDKCSSQYTIRYARINHVCYPCRKRDSMIGNTIGNMKKKFDPPYEEFKTYLTEHGGVKTAKYYGVTLSQVLTAKNRLGIEIEAYKGRRHPVPSDFQEHVHDLTIDALSKKYGVARTVINRWCSDLKIEKSTQFQVWEDRKNIVRENFDAIRTRNLEVDLLTIVGETGYSIEHLKAVFRENDVPVVLHSYNKSAGENELREWIQSLGMDCYSIKKTFNGKQYEIDCLIESHNLGIEYCGEFWHSEINKEKTYHFDKYQWCRDQGIELLTIFESEWKSRPSIIRSMICNKLGLSQRLYARKCVVVELSSMEAYDFHQANHIAGGLYSKINYGLEHDGKLVSVVSVSKNRFKDDGLEITRFSSLLNTVVVGGFSRLLKRLPSNLTSFADLRYGSGNVYTQNGFVEMGITPPNYWYFKKDNSGLLESRLKYQKHKLPKLLENFDPSLSEHQNMLNHGYLRIFDCGNRKFVLKNQKVDK